MASSRLRETTAAGSVPYWGVPKVLIHRFANERFELFVTFWLAMYSGVGVLLPLGLYKWVLRSPWWLGMAAVGVAGCVVLGVALRLARHGRYQQSITLVCIGN